MTVPPVPAGPPAPPGAPAPKTRPATVLAAGILELVLAALALIWGGLSLVTIMVGGDELIRDQMEEARRQGQEIPEGQFDTMVNFAKSIAYGTSVIILLFGVGLAVLGFLVLKGSRVGRILSWIGVGGFTLCGLCSLGGNATQTGATAVLGSIIPVVVLICGLAVIVLLALPASNRYFAKEVPQWEPPAEFGSASTEFGGGTPPAGTAPPGATTPPTGLDPWAGAP
ncbi:MAG: hypothetical protein ACRDT4_10990, partial [Micromonosporaceae bacterium]